MSEQTNEQIQLERVRRYSLTQAKEILSLRSALEHAERALKEKDRHHALCDQANANALEGLRTRLAEADKIHEAREDVLRSWTTAYSQLNEKYRLAHERAEAAEQRGRDAESALRGAQEILAEPGTPPKSVWRAWQAEHAGALSAPPPGPSQE